MATALRPIGHEDRLSVVDHLGELRNRLFISAGAFVVAFIFCFWQNHAILHLLNKPLEDSTPTTQKHAGGGRVAQQAAALAAEQKGLALAQKGARALAASRTQNPADRAHFAVLDRGLNQAAKALPATLPKREPITIGVGEPFTSTLKVAALVALLLSLPVILYQLYAFVLPAFSPVERRAVMPLLLLVPVLFTAGLAFAFFVVLGPAISFLQNFNSTNFDVFLQAKSYYDFEILVLLAMGLVFQLPIGLLALQRVGIISARTLTQNWRYAIVIIAVGAAALPGVDPFTTILEMIPLLALYALSIVLLKAADRRRPQTGTALADRFGWNDLDDDEEEEEDDEQDEHDFHAEDDDGDDPRDHDPDDREMRE